MMEPLATAEPNRPICSSTSTTVMLPLKDDPGDSSCHTAEKSCAADMTLTVPLTLNPTTSPSCVGAKIPSVRDARGGCRAVSEARSDASASCGRPASKYGLMVSRILVA